MAGTLIWYGDRIAARMAEAARRAIDETMDAAVVVAARDLPGSTTPHILEPAAKYGQGVRGFWGSRSYLAWILEIGSPRRPSGWDIRPMPKRGKKALASSETVYGRRVHHPAITGRHALRRAADAQYPTLRGRIARHFVRGR